METNSLFQPIFTLTDKDIRLLLTILHRELTLEDIVSASGEKYEYSRKRMGVLKKQGIVDVRVIGKQHFYSCRRNSLTESLFELAETQTSDSKVIRFPFFGLYTTIPEAIGIQAKREYNWLKQTGNLSAPQFLVRLVCHIKNRSWRKANSLHPTVPSEEEMRTLLEQYIIEMKRNLALAEQLYNTPRLWDGSIGTWKLISEEEPDSTVKAFSKEMFDMYGPKTEKDSE